MLGTIQQVHCLFKKKEKQTKKKKKKKRERKEKNRDTVIQHYRLTSWKSKHHQLIKCFVPSGMDPQRFLCMRIETGNDYFIGWIIIWGVSRENIPVFVIVISKRRMGAHGRAHPSFGMTPTFREYDLWRQKTQILKSQYHTKKRMGAATRAHPTFGMTTTKTFRSVFSRCTLYFSIIQKLLLARLLQYFFFW